MDMKLYALAIQSAQLRDLGGGGWETAEEARTRGTPRTFARSCETENRVHSHQVTPESPARCQVLCGQVRALMSVRPFLFSPPPFRPGQLSQPSLRSCNHAQVNPQNSQRALSEETLTCFWVVLLQNRPHRPLECVPSAFKRPRPTSKGADPSSRALTSPQSSLRLPLPSLISRPITPRSPSPLRSSFLSPACSRAMSDRPRSPTEQRATTGVSHCPLSHTSCS